MYYALEKPDSEELLTDFLPASQLPALQARARRLSKKTEASIYLLASTTTYRRDACGQFVYVSGILSWVDGVIREREPA